MQPECDLDGPSEGSVDAADARSVSPIARAESRAVNAPNALGRIKRCAANVRVPTPRAAIAVRRFVANFEKSRANCGSIWRFALS